MRKSKAIRLGNATAVVLPIDWVRGNGIKHGDLLDVQYDEIVKVRPIKAGISEGGTSAAKRTPELLEKSESLWTSGRGLPLGPGYLDESCDKELVMNKGARIENRRD